MLETLGEAEGFVETGDQDRFDECEGAVTSALSQIRRVAKQWKVGLLRSNITMIFLLIHDDKGSDAEEQILRSGRRSRERSSGDYPRRYIGFARYHGGGISSPELTLSDNECYRRHLHGRSGPGQILFLEETDMNN